MKNSSLCGCAILVALNGSKAGADGQSGIVLPVNTPAPLIEKQLSLDETQNAISELRGKHLLIPILDKDPEMFKRSFYEKRANMLHHAVDIPAPRNTPILACDAGRIARLFLSKLGGTTIYMFDRTGKFIYYYAHLEGYADNLAEGDFVCKGQVLGFVGTSGNAPANFPHLHFSISKAVKPGVWYPSAPIDPYEVFKK